MNTDGILETMFGNDSKDSTDKNKDSNDNEMDVDKTNDDEPIYSNDDNPGGIFNKDCNCECDCDKYKLCYGQREPPIYNDINKDESDNSMFSNKNQVDTDKMNDLSMVNFQLRDTIDKYDEKQREKLDIESDDEGIDDTKLTKRKRKSSGRMKKKNLGALKKKLKIIQTKLDKLTKKKQKRGKQNQSRDKPRRRNKKQTKKKPRRRKNKKSFIDEVWTN